MSTTQLNKAPPTKPRKDRERERKEKEKQQHPGSERLKTVVRRLPPNLPESVFWQSVETWATDQTVTWKTYYQGKFRKRLNKENIPSRAYIAFKTEEQLARFGREYDGHLFKDKAGNESYAIVEFAPYQKVPSEKKKPDARNATIEQDEDYISFLNALNAPATTEPVSMETLVAAIQHLPAPKTTPLLEALKAEKSAHKDKEAILRNHAHYKDQPVAAASTPRKDDSKKKGGPIPASKVTPATTLDAGNNVAPGAVKKSHKKGQAPASAAAPTHPPTATQKVTAQVNPAAKNINGPPIPGPVPKSPKVSRGARLPPQSKGGTKTAPTPTLEAPVVSPPAPGDSGPPPRRSRPVIGLPSRHFEAALNGAGVSAQGERKPRREREREKEKEKDVAAVPPSSGPAESKHTHFPPRRDRGGRKESSQAHTPSMGGTAGGGGPLDSLAKVPGILQRADGPLTSGVGMPRTDSDGGVVAPAQETGAPSCHGGRGGRRGRGRGRGARGG